MTESLPPTVGAPAATGASAAPGAPAPAVMTGAPAPRRRGRRTGRVWDAHLILSIGALTMLFPFLWQIKLSLSTRAEATAIPINLWPEELQWENFVRAFEIIPFAEQMGVTVAYALARAAAELVTCSLAGYAFARMRFPLRGPIFFLILTVLMVPGQIFLIPQYQMVQAAGLLDSFAAILAPGLVSAFGTFFMMQYFRKIPEELTEAARLDGCSPWQSFWLVVMPLARPALLSLAVITLLAAWNNLLWPLVVISTTEKFPIAVGLAALQGDHLRGTDYPVVMAASLMAMLPVFLAFVIFQKRVIDGFALSSFR